MQGCTLSFIGGLNLLDEPKNEDHKLNWWAQELVEGRIQRIAVSTDTGGAMEMIPQFEDAPIPTTFVGSEMRTYRDKYGNEHPLRDWYFPKGHPLFPDGMIVQEQQWLSPEHSGKAYCLGLWTIDGWCIKNSLCLPESVGADREFPPKMIGFPA